MNNDGEINTSCLRLKLTDSEESSLNKPLVDEDFVDKRFKLRLIWYEV